MSAILLALVMAPTPTLAFTEAEPADWLGRRAEVVMAKQLRSLGYRVRPSTALTRAGSRDIVLRLSSTPTGVDRATTSVEFSISARGLQPEVARVKGRAGDLERLVAGLSATVAQRLGRGSIDHRQLVPTPLPFRVHRQLGRAEDRLRKGRWRQAMLGFDQVGRTANTGLVPEALLGRRRAFLALVAEDKAQIEQHSGLAAASVERAEVAQRMKDRAGAIRAWEGFLSYTDDYALRWQVRGRLRRRSRLHASRDDFVVVSGRRSWRVDARTGRVTVERRVSPRTVAVLDDETLHLEDRILSRRTARGKTRWKLGLPFGSVRPQDIFTTSGMIGVLGVDTVLWADAGLGHMGQVSRLTPPLASSAGGVLVRLPHSRRRTKPPSTPENPKVDPQTPPGVGLQDTIGLLRPGRRTPAWRVGLPPVKDARLTRARVAVITDDGLFLLRTHDGRPARPVRPWPDGARWLHAEGRYATAAGAQKGEVIIFDILAGRQTGRAQGPGRPVAALTLSDGVAVLFETADVFQLDREGRLLDRARPPGRPIQLVQGHPLAPGPVVLTSEGIFAYAEVRLGVKRDVDALLALSRAYADEGRTKAALRLASAVAAASAGRVADAEAWRASLWTTLRQPAAAATAQARARAAADPTLRLPRVAATK